MKIVIDVLFLTRSDSKLSLGNWKHSGKCFNILFNFFHLEKSPTDEAEIVMWVAETSG